MGENDSETYPEQVSPAFFGGTAISERIQYTLEEQESESLAYKAENSCITCSRLFSNDMLKVVPPRYLLDRDHYVRNGIVSRRFLCLPCYCSMKSKARSRLRRSIGISRFRHPLIKAVINEILVKR